MSVKITVDIDEDQLYKLLTITELTGGEPFEKTIKDVIDIAIGEYADMIESEHRKREKRK